MHSHGESGTSARLVPLTVNGLIWAASMVILDSNRRARPVPPLAAIKALAGRPRIVRLPPNCPETCRNLTLSSA
ncbi:hypothetical protein [Actinoallomurus sp. CA-150999]|uniref:hypothetical protein n=1 Tax=Actinoallomurus sp. CA-150999 TaxID=3239887 RepID=UPI003D8B498F